MLLSVSSYHMEQYQIISDVLNITLSMAFESSLNALSQVSSVCKVKHTWICIEPYTPLKRWGVTRVVQEITQFYLPPNTSHTYLYFPAAKHHRSLAGTHFPVQLRIGGWVGMSTQWVSISTRLLGWISNPRRVWYESNRPILTLNTQTQERFASCWNPINCNTRWSAFWQL